MLQDLGQLEEALISLDLAIALQPDNARAHNNRGVVLHGLMHDDEALASHDKATALKPEYAEAHYNRGIVLRELDRLDDALAVLTGPSRSNGIMPPPTTTAAPCCSISIGSKKRSPHSIRQSPWRAVSPRPP